MRQLGFRGFILVISLCCVAGGELAAGETWNKVASAPYTDKVATKAVSSLNGHATLLSGWLEDSVNDTGMAALASLFSLPIGENLGFQTDSLIAFSHGEFGGGIAGHLFWRDPTAGMAGIFGQWVARHQPNWKTWRAGVEGEIYLDQLSVGTVLGYEIPKLPNGISSQEDIFAIADLSYYPNDDFRILTGYRYLNRTNIAALGLETKLFALPMASLLLEGRLGQRDYAAVWTGLRWRFGEIPKTLKRHHRKDGVGDTERESIFQINVHKEYRD